MNDKEFYWVLGTLNPDSVHSYCAKGKIVDWFIFWIFFHLENGHIPLEEMKDIYEIFSGPKWLFKYGSNPLAWSLPFLSVLPRSYNEHQVSGCLVDVNDLAVNRTELPCLHGEFSLEGIKAKIRVEYDELFIEVSFWNELHIRCSINVKWVSKWIFKNSQSKFTLFTY